MAAAGTEINLENERRPGRGARPYKKIAKEDFNEER